MFVIIWREAKHWWKLLGRLVCCGSIYTPEAWNVNMRVCQHHTTWGHLSKQSTFHPHSSVVYSAKQEQIEQRLTSLAFHDFQPVETTDKPKPRRQTLLRYHGNCLWRPCSLFWKMEWALSVQCLRLCHCYTVCCWAAVDLFPLCDWSKQPYHRFSSRASITQPSGPAKETTQCSLWNHFKPSRFHDFLLWIWFL